MKECVTGKQLYCLPVTTTQARKACHSVLALPHPCYPCYDAAAAATVQYLEHPANVVAQRQSHQLNFVSAM